MPGEIFASWPEGWCHATCQWSQSCFRFLSQLQHDTNTSIAVHSSQYLSLKTQGSVLVMIFCRDAGRKFSSRRHPGRADLGGPSALLSSSEGGLRLLCWGKWAHSSFGLHGLFWARPNFGRPSACFTACHHHLCQSKGPLPDCRLH